MAAFIYSLCAVTSCLCAVFLLRGYLQSRYRLLLWAGICFLGLTINNVLIVADKIIFPNVDMLTIRLVITLVAVGFLLYGLIFDE